MKPREGYHSGMRLEEILNLTWDRVDLDKGRIYLPDHLTKTGQEKLVPSTPTSEKIPPVHLISGWGDPHSRPRLSSR